MYAGYYPHPRPVDEVIDAGRPRGEARRAGATSSPAASSAVSTWPSRLAGDPELLFLDEPTTGFDPSARRDAWEMVEDLAALGKTVLLTTHYMDEAQYLADRVAVIAAGEIVAEGTPADARRAGRGARRIRFRPPGGRRAAARSAGPRPTPDGTCGARPTTRPRRCTG